MSIPPLPRPREDLGYKPLAEGCDHKWEPRPDFVDGANCAKCGGFASAVQIAAQRYGGWGR